MDKEHSLINAGSGLAHLGLSGPVDQSLSKTLLPLPPTTTAHTPLPHKTKTG